MVLDTATKSLMKASSIKRHIELIDDLLADNEAWTLQQQLLNTYREVLILDLDFALDKKVEQDLWNYAIKSYISKLQYITKEKKHPKRSDAQALLMSCLDVAAGFYLRLIQEVCSAFQIDLPFRRNDIFFGLEIVNAESFQGTVPKKSSTYYLCQHCLVHLGDIARYRNQNRQAEIFYKYAMMIIPSSGQPYNQLALLEASRGDKVSAVYYYVRAIALSHPFSVAASNLSKALEKHSDDTVKMDGNGKLSAHEYLAAFLKLHGLLYSYSELDKAEKLVQILTTSLTAHIATESLPGWKLVQIVVINIFAMVRSFGHDSKKEEMTATERRVQSLVSHFMAGCLNAFLLPVYTMKPDEPHLEYFAMPAIKLTLDWIRLQPKVLTSPGFSTRRQIWPSLCCLFRLLQTSTKNFKARNYVSVPLPEDRDLRGFLYFDELLSKFNFYTEDTNRGANTLNKLRAARVLEFGTWLSQQNPPLITRKVQGNEKSGSVVFEPVEHQERPEDLLKELEELTMGKNQTYGNGSISSPDARVHNVASELMQEKKGILKNESTSEKSAELKSGPRASKSIAQTSFASSKTDDIKQVTFRTPSPLSAIDLKLTQQKKALEPNEGSDLEKSQQKQQVLSALFDETKPTEKVHTMSGLLNLNKHQQELLSISKQPPRASRPAPQKMKATESVVEKMEAARKEYEDAMSVLQQRQMEQERYPGEDFYRMYASGPPPQQPPPPPQHVFVRVNTPMMNMGPMQPFAFKVQPGVMMPWQEPDHPPPLPPASWWAQPPMPHPQNVPGNQPGPPAYRQPPPTLNTYSLWEPNPNMQIPGRLVSQQSFWSGPGPSPLERLLEQQRKQMLDSDTHT